MPQIALNWLLQRPTVATVIIGARNEEQLRQNLGAVGWNLTAEQVARLDAASAVHARLSLLAPARLRRAEPAAGLTWRQIFQIINQSLHIISSQYN